MNFLRLSTLSKILGTPVLLVTSWSLRLLGLRILALLRLVGLFVSVLGVVQFPIVPHGTQDVS